MTESISNLAEPAAIDRRTLLTRAGVGGAGLLMGGFLAGCGGNNDHNSNNSGSKSDYNDLDILNFALNLEYLEASYYTIGTGQFQLIPAQVTGAVSGNNDPGGGPIVGGAPVSLPTLGGYFNEIAYDESNHVTALRALITARGGKPVARPTIDFTNAFAAAGAAAGNPGFNPFTTEANFLLGAFLLSDVGVTAYVGGSQYLSAQEVKLAAAKILATEAYHVGSIRTLIANTGGTAVANSQAIAGARQALNAGMTPPITDQGVDADVNNVSGSHNIALTDAAGLAFGRSTSEVLAEVYLSKVDKTASGGFFPNGVNGSVRTVSNPGSAT